MEPVAACPLCGVRKARRGCPALGRQICAVCCGTKRLVEIDCPPDCAYLATAREHPPAASVRRQEQDTGLLIRWVHDLSERQSRLFVALSTFLARYEPPDLQPALDEDVLEATAALAATLETSARGVIYEHRPASLPAERLVSALRPVLAEAGKGGGGSAFERESAVVLRRMGEAVREAGRHAPSNRRAFLELLVRVTRPGRAEAPAPDEAGPQGSRLIVP